jgi:hypothetical protein
VADAADRIAAALAADVELLLAHPLYAQVDSVARLRMFMREHAFAVWDFMTLLKRLQRDVCGSSAGPWLPPASPSLARFVNEINLGEESDTDGRGGFASHFHLYLEAMDEIGADSGPIRELVERLRSGQSAASVLGFLPVRDETREFVRFNLNVAASGTPWEAAAVFCFGREDIIPEMFQRLLTSMGASGCPAERFRFYLERHIDLDQNEHGPLARQLTAELTEGREERIAQAIAAGRQALAMRRKLWDGILSRLTAAAVAAEMPEG